MIEKLIFVLALWVATTGIAFALFSAGGPGTVPEPGTGALLAAGALVAGGLRYLTKRKK